jgi:hypothetical protein
VIDNGGTREKPGIERELAQTLLPLGKRAGAAFVNGKLS